MYYTEKFELDILFVAHNISFMDLIYVLKWLAHTKLDGECCGVTPNKWRQFWVGMDASGP